MDSQENIFKVVLLGDAAVGKTSIANRFVNERFDDVRSSLGVEMFPKIIVIGGVLLKLQIWDTVGMDRFAEIQTQYYRKADGIMVLYDLTDRSTFETVTTKWIPKIADNCENKNVSIVLIGNKCDSEDRKVTDEEQKQRFYPFQYTFFEASAKQNINIKEAFEYLTVQMYRKQVSASDSKKPQPSTIDLGDNTGDSKKKSCCN